ncbi:phage holin family protein [Bacillus sp. JCM 19041]|uniref:phage holin family protein n=1 Tax=Bacillus sp. JCM 19041 TaxID=1460637 RepID=UPI0006D0DA2C
MYQLIQHALFDSLLGNWNTLFISLLIFISLDFITSIVRAIYEKQMSHRFVLDIFWRKCSIFFIILMAHVLDQLLIADGVLLFHTSFQTLVMWSYLVYEAISILDNLHAMGVYVPAPIIKTIALLQRRND